MNRTLLKLYGCIFAVCGAVFVLASAQVLALLNFAVPFLPGATPFSETGPSLWLGLSGSMMAMIAWLSFALAENPDQDLAWNALLLSKAASTTLFSAFTVSQRNSLFAIGALVDGSIFAHLAFLRATAERTREPFAARLPSSLGPFYEAWFVKLNDRAAQRAVWLRCEAVRAKSGASEASCAWALFENGRVMKGRFARPLSEAAWGINAPFRLGECVLEHGRFAGRADGTHWDFSWKPQSTPPFRFMPDILAATGLASSDYVATAPFALFDGTLTLGNRLISFKDAPGCAGHLWGRKMADNWRWVQAIIEDENGQINVFELLAAQVRLGPWRSPRLTCAHLWRAGVQHRSVGLARALSNSTRGDASMWTFRASFDELNVEGECIPGPIAEFEYVGPDGHRLRCRNSKTGRLTLRMNGQMLSTADGAAVEWVETVP